MIRILSNILFITSMAALVAALVVIAICVAGGRPDLSYPASNVLALAGICFGLVAMGLSGMCRRVGNDNDGETHAGVKP